MRPFGFRCARALLRTSTRRRRPQRGGAGLFAYEHVFLGDEIAEEIAAAGLEVRHRQDLSHQSVAWLSPVS
jgi:hypothetical protein